MNFLIADTFTGSLARLTGEEQKAVKMTAFDLQMDPANPGMKFHKLDGAKDKNFWSVRVNRDIRLIVHKTPSSLLLCYVDHHDDAYRWAQRRKLETHPTTGAAQLVEVRETIEEIQVPKYVQPAQPRLFKGVRDQEMLAFGVPPEWLDDVKEATEDSILDLVDHLPAEAAEALLELATGGKPAAANEMRLSLSEELVAPSTAVPHENVTARSAFSHPDALRRFRTIENAEDLARALDFPWDKWTVFLHPDQKQIVEKNFSGPARVAGTAGTGKTVVALHRAVHLAERNSESRVLITTFSTTLANALRNKVSRLISNKPRLAERIEVSSVDKVGERLYEVHFGAATLATDAELRDLLAKQRDTMEKAKFSGRFLLEEWKEVVDAWQIDTWEEYRDVARLGRKTRLPELQREPLWSIFLGVKRELMNHSLITRAEMFNKLAKVIRERKHPPYEFVVVDESQDLNVPQLRFLAALGSNRPNSLFFAGDLGQRIFQIPFSWKSLGVEIRGRSQTLKVNYRTSHQIRSQADRLLGPQIADVDGVVEDRRGAISVFNGPRPEIKILETQDDEIDAVANWLRERIEEGVNPGEVGVFVRSPAQLERAQAAVERAGVECRTLDENMATVSNRLSIGTMHLAKGLEFKSVAVMACDDEVLPLQERIESVGDDADLEEVYDTERHLLYVACTRARDNLLVTSTEPESEFLDDLAGR